MKKIIIKSIFDISGLSNVFVKKSIVCTKQDFHTHERGRRKNALLNAVEQKSIQMKKNVLGRKTLRLIETVDHAEYSLIK